MFVLLMLFLFKYIDDMIGKGFEWYIILELMLYASATNVAMALPLSVLLSSIMTYGSLGENYELVAIKSAGISLSRAMYPMIIVVTLLSMGAFFFSDYMLPVANYKYYSLLYDVRQQKAAFLITPGIFNSSIPNYSIRVREKDPNGQILKGVMIYERNTASNINNVLFAKEGYMYRTPDDEQLVLKLKDGIRWQEQASDQNPSDYRQQLIRFRFKETEQRFSLEGFHLKRTKESDWKSTIQMMNLKQLDYNQKMTIKRADSTVMSNFSMISAYFKYFTIPHKITKHIPQIKAKADVLASADKITQRSIVAGALNEARSIKGMMSTRVEGYKDISKDIRKYSIEYQKKFTLPAACLALFLIGAPLGAIIRKGGLGLPVVVAVIFFLIYYIIATIGEKSAKEGNLSPTIGMWIAIVILTPVGLFLSYKAATDSVLFDSDAYKRFFRKFFRKKATV
jgi:lipopolysaccharide export system permease protein